MTEQQKVEIKIPTGFSADQRKAIAIELVDCIIDNTRSGKGVKKKGDYWDYVDFPKYSKEYKKSFEFKIAGKSSKVDLTLTGDMLDSLMVLDARKKDKLVIGYDKGDPINGKVEGNRIGSYGKPNGDKSKARDFLGISKDDLNAILEKHILDLPKARAYKVLQSDLLSKELAQIIVDEFEDE